MSANRQNPAKEWNVKSLGNRFKKSIGLGSRRTASSAAVGDGSLTASSLAKGHGSSTAGAISPVEAAELRAKYKHFRILVIGRANAGKTTLLKRVCNTTEEPSIYDDSKNLVSYSILCQMSDTYHFQQLIPTSRRGMHDIHRAFRFKSNPKFIFHDSAGFEAGGEEELKAVMDFIEKCSKASIVDDQIHIIWFCFDPDVSRPLLDLEVKFFNEKRKWNVPVVAIFMKFDDLISQVWDRNSTSELNTMHALDTLQQKFEQPLRNYQFPPHAYVRLEGLDKNEIDHQKQIGELMKQTAASIDDLALKMLFVTVQQNNLKICIKYAIQQYVISLFYVYFAYYVF
ncbi:hypothetical protein CVT25_004905 [Psilocybe cyanescens]|uniref:Uncharacterized protein n=1 Tax=Psilocybe cyanescens TaxID=93625 RepID=A0A409XBK6_PSICY|nr:hypothetical protein CVT25_004905 [Psilocybe cyanescens]